MTDAHNWFTLGRARTHAWALLTILWGASTVNYATHGSIARNGHLKGGDYAHFYVIGRLAAEHRGPDMYDAAAQKREFSQALPGVEPPNYLPFLYAPHVGLLLAPFGLLPYLPSVALWWLISTLAYLSTTWFVWTHCTRLTAPKLDFILFALAYPGFWELFIHGHTTWLALVCFVMIWSALRRDRWLVAGIALGVLAYKPQLGIAVFLVLVASRQWRVLLCASAVIVLQVGITAAWFGRGVFDDYARMLRLLPKIAPLVEPDLHKLCSVRGFFTVLGVPSSWAFLGYLLVSAALCGWLLRIWKTREFDVAFAALLIVSVLIAPHATVYDLVLLGPAFILLANANLGAVRPDRLWPLMYASYLLAITGALVQSLHFQLATPVLILLLRGASMLVPDRS